MREDSERNRLRPTTHHDGAEEATDQVQPDGCCKRPCDVRAKSQLSRSSIGSSPPQDDGCGQHKTDNQPPTTLFQWGETQAIGGWWRLKCQPKQLPNQLDGIPVNRRQHIEANDVECEDAEKKRCNPKRA